MAVLRGGLLLLLHACVLRCVWSKLELRVEDSVEVLLGTSAHVPCDYSFSESSQEPPFVMLQWFVRSPGNSSRARIFYGDSEQQLVDNHTEYSERVQVSSGHNHSVLTIADARLSDQREFFCQVNGLAAGSAEGKTTLRVYAPPEPPVVEEVSVGVSVTEEQPAKIAVCEAQNGFPKPNITWLRNGEPLEASPGQVKFLVLHSRSSSGLYTVQNTLLLKVQKDDRDALFSCRVTFFVPGGTRSQESSPFNVTVHYPTSMVELWKESPPGLLKEGDTVELRCQGDGHPPPAFVFTREQQPDVPLESRGDVLILSSVTRSDSGLYQCRPGQPYADSEAKGEVQLRVHYLDPAVVVPKESEIMLRGEDLTATCNALSSLATSTVWYKDGRVVGTGSSLHLQDAGYHTAGEYMCEVTVPTLPALHTHSSVHIIVQGPPQMEQEQEVRLEQPTGRVLNLSCEAQGHPPPSVTWTLSTGQAWEEVVSRATSHSSLSVVSVRVAADFSAVCNASNELGAEARVFNVKAVPMVTTPAAFSPVEGSGIFIVVIILGLLLLAVLGSVLYFLHKKGRLPCGRSGKQSITKEKSSAKDIVVELKTEESVLLRAVNGDKRTPSEQ